MNSTFLYTVLILSVLGAILAILLYWVAQRFKVEEDPRIEVIAALLPGANCGGCGFAGCRAVAEHCVTKGSLEGCFCPVGGNETMKQIAAVLGLEAPVQEPKVSVLRCHGTCAVRPKTTQYDGMRSCAVAVSLYPGETGCAFGCLGLGDCVSACTFGGISMNPQTGLPQIDDSLCTACGACIKKCPKGLLEARPRGPKDRRVWVACASKDKGAVVRKVCAAGCIGCKACEKACPFGAITVTDSLAYIDASKCKLCRKCVAACPTGCIKEAHFPKKETPTESV